ncbi:hypothetical protein WN55_00269 [Dufourea novaeangliae]|uniref:Uncharacterized protein n=1 Tax=Dufourea novaeangliae TaxID=178035 RepID=A0A154PCT6_DUFNO|nr:hypothetical protein WN55_00269 [Dufourea novaeangliae]
MCAGIVGPGVDWLPPGVPMAAQEARLAHVTPLAVARSGSRAAGTSRQAMPPADDVGVMVSYYDLAEKEIRKTTEVRENLHRQSGISGFQETWCRRWWHISQRSLTVTTSSFAPSLGPILAKGMDDSRISSKETKTTPSRLSKDKTEKSLVPQTAEDPGE